MEHLKDIEHFERQDLGLIFSKICHKRLIFPTNIFIYLSLNEVFVIEGVPVVKLVSPTVYGQASQPDHAFNNASGHFEKK